MELDDLQRQWKQLDEKLDRAIEMQRDFIRLSVTRGARRRVNLSAVWPVMDVAFGASVAACAGAFLAKHVTTPALLLPAGFLLIGALMLLIDGICQLVRLSEIDWGGALADIQVGLSRIHIAKVRQFKWVILLSPLVGFCGLIVAFQAVLDRLPQPRFVLDILDAKWVAGNYVFGVLFIPIGLAVTRFLAGRYGGKGWWQRVVSDLSGTTLRRTRQELDRWVRLEDGLAAQA